MTKILRILFCGLVVVAPWLCGAITPRPQFFLAAVLVGITVLRFIQRLFAPQGARSGGIPTAMLVAIGFLLIGIWQLSPSTGHTPLSDLKSASFGDLIPSLVESPELTGFARGLKTLSPEATRLALAQIVLAVLAFWLSFDLFDDPTSRYRLYFALAINGLAMTGFGIAQQLTWNGKLFWTIPLRFGGSPFGPFVNRNNAAGYLLLAFSCATACLISAWFPFGLGPRISRSESWRAKLSGWLLTSLGHMTPQVLLAFASVAGIVVGILASLSRAGAIGLITAMLVLIPALNRWKTRMLVFAMTSICFAYGVLIWMGQNEKISKRLESLGDFSSAMQGRVEHWQEAVHITRDFPWTGCGWGTYSLVNPVYVSRNHDVWFVHAENQYVEVLAEAGVAGLALFATGLLLLTYASARAIRSDQDGRQLTSGLCGLLSVVAIATHSLSDFSLSIGSIVFTFCVIAGSVYSSYLALSKAHPVSPWILLATSRPRWRFLITGVLLIVSGLAFSMIHAASEIEPIVDTIPVEAEFPTITTAECDFILTRLNILQRRHPKNPELLAALGDIHIYRYRRMMYDSLALQPTSQALGSRRLWASTNLERLDDALGILRLNGDSEAERQLLDRPEIRQNLPAALEAFKQCLPRNPLQRHGASLKRAWLSHLSGKSSTPTDLELALFAGASDADILFQAGQLANRLGESEVCTRCWKRCLEISDMWSERVWDEATLTRDESETLQLYPDRLPPLLAIIPRPKDRQVRQAILNRCQAIMTQTPDTPPLSQAQLAVAMNDFPKAADAYLQAIRESPRDVNLRMEASEALERAGHLEKAREVIGGAMALAPDRLDVKQRFQSLIDREKHPEIDP